MARVGKLLLIFIITVSLALTAGCGSSGSDKDKAADEGRDYYKVGVITELSGGNAYGGNLTRRGYDTWAETVNSKGGIKIGDKQYTVEMIYADAQSEPAAGADAVERMITKEKVDFILGPYSSAVTLAVAPICEKYQVPLITGSAESPMIWEQGFKYTYGTVPAVDLTASYPLEGLAEAGAKTIAIIGKNDSFSKATAEAFKSKAESLGLEVVRYEIVPEGTDFTPILSVIKGLKPDIVAVGAHEKEHMEVIKASKSLNFMPGAFLMHYGVTNPDFVNNLGKDAENVYGATVWVKDSNYSDPLFGSTKETAEAYQVRWGDYPDYTASGCICAGIAFQVALENLALAPPLSDEGKNALRQELEELEVETFYGVLSFAKEGKWYHNNIGLTALTVQVQNGEVKVVGPAAAREANPIYPVPSWGER